MRELLSKAWWVLLLRGLVAVGFGAFALLQPGITLQSLLTLFGSTATVGGILDIVGAVSARSERDDWWVWLLQGIVGLLIGVLTFFQPGTTGLALLFFIAMWALAIGVLQIVAAVRLRKEIKGEGWLILAGVASVALSIILVTSPGAGALGLIYYIGAQALITGVTLVMLSLKVRKLAAS